MWGSGFVGQPVKKMSSILDEKSKIFGVASNIATKFRLMYDRGDLPVFIRHGAKLSLEFKVPIESLDIVHFLPIFVDGIREHVNPYHFIASEGTLHLIKYGESSKILLCLDRLIYPLKEALETYDSRTILLSLKVIQGLSSANPDIAKGLVGYFRQLLPVLNRFKTRKRNLGDQMDFAQFKHDGRTLGEEIEETLTALERNCGDSAFINIKYIVPTYESCRMNE